MNNPDLGVEMRKEVEKYGAEIDKLTCDNCAKGISIYGEGHVFHYEADGKPYTVHLKCDSLRAELLPLLERVWKDARGEK